MRRLLCASRNDDFNFFYSVLAGLGLRNRTAKVADEVTAPGERQEWVCKTTFSRRTQRPLADFAEPPQSKRRKGLRRKSGVFCARSVSAGVVTRCFSPCLIFWCFWIKTKAHKKEYAPQKKSILRKEFRRQDRCVVSAGRRPWDTPTVAGLRRRRLQPARRKGPQYFKPDCGVSQGRNLACTARCSVNSRKVRSSRRFPPVPLRSDRHDAPRHPEGQQTYRKEHTAPPDKQREPFPMKRFPFSFPRRIPPDPA